MRYRITVEYDGGPFVGWQRQDNGASVQGALEAAILKLSGEGVTVTGAGRTDAGVHALGQVAHFDLVKEFTPDKIRDALNHYLRPQPAVVLESRIVDAEFHARFSAKTPVMSGMSCAISTPRRCITRRRRLSAGTISPPSAPQSARRNLR
jgi:tRNA pseudouridine38-40 synthase